MKLDLSLSKKQLAFLKADADEVLFGGAAGGGKSHAQLIDALLYAIRYQKSRQLILRRTYPELEQTLIVKSLGMFPKGLAVYNATAHIWIFSCGSIIQFGYCDAERAVHRYQGSEYDVIRFDELTHFTEFQYLYLLSRLRGVNDFPKQIKSTANPGGVGHSWVKARFVDARPAGEKGQGENGRTLLYLPAKVWDNPFIMRADPGYIDRLRELPEAQRKALLDGDWNIFEGQYFTGWDPEIHVIRPFAIPAHWRRTVAIDYGLDMLAALWIAVDESGRGVVYRELCSGKDGDFFNNGNAKIAGTKPLLVTEAARAIRENTPAGEKIFNRVGPPDLWNRHQDTGESTAELFAREGLPLTKASNERAQGWMALAEWLKIGTDEQGKPSAGLRIFENCRVLIASLPQLQYSDRDADDCASEPHAITHAPDALRYFVAGRPIPSGAAPKEDPFAPEEDEIESFLNFGR